MFNEAELRDKLVALPVAQRRAFAAAVATRQVVSLERVAEKRYNLADRLWQGIAAGPCKRDLWTRRITLLPRLVPSCDAFRPCSSYVRQAMASLGYAMLCRLSGDSDDAFRSAKCAVNAASLAQDHIRSVCQMDVPNNPTGAATLSQREVEHQTSDVDYLSLGWLEEIRWNSYANPMLTHSEAVLLSAIS